MPEEHRPLLPEGAEGLRDPTLTQVLGQGASEQEGRVTNAGEKPASLTLSGGLITPRLKGQGRWPGISVTFRWLKDNKRLLLRTPGFAKT